MAPSQANLLCRHFVRQIRFPLLPRLEEEVDGSGDDKEEAIGDDVASWNDHLIGQDPSQVASLSNDDKSTWRLYDPLLRLSTNTTYWYSVLTFGLKVWKNIFFDRNGLCYRDSWNANIICWITKLGVANTMVGQPFGLKEPPFDFFNRITTKQYTKNVYRCMQAFVTSVPSLFH